jgi:DNA-binding NarL/FixJ family response regulator
MSRISVRVLAADPVSRAGAQAQLRFRPELEVVERGPSAVSLIVADNLDDSVLEQVRHQRRAENSRVVLVCGRVTDDDVFAGIEAGASGLLRRADATPDRLVRALTAAVIGDGSLPPDLLGRLLENVGAAQRNNGGSRAVRMTTLSDRERQVLRLVADGHSTGEIARALAYSERTIKNAIHDLVTRLQLRNRAHAVAFAVREGLI